MALILNKMRTRKSILLTCTAVALLVTFPAQSFAFTLNVDSLAGMRRGQAEYFNLNQEQRGTVKIHLLGGVASPGVYRLPDNATLLEAIALAGGTTAAADIEKVRVRRNQNGETKTFEYSLSDLVGDRSRAVPLVANNDMVLIENMKPSPPPVLTIVATIVGVISSGLLAYLTVKTITKKD